ncbi:tRNA uridine-5-carboxymethylaminomethyl(34) synthesis GTPase MnmE [Desulfomonile tiedjei]|uniref:tRNA modification GTPase MnmE n=1 Tax=Desulfomonile tiedjei (strain ATCC 49306 / DSM 6799 / DCB-1) TaxID=706587 RepID=I4CAJ0_DESTA|nr:tRNA uridine-5-carboxymethylaminomethyl(34) synthesis GTPase MnmE [Desulfomonile tiedjei]AFM26581.1 tRNA modification GTPase TrmE [Desulfomonile tiedjei DSM 6799]
MTMPTPDTIVAISTPRGYSGIGVVRMSGPDSLPILTQIFMPTAADGFNDRTAVHGKLVDRDGRILDDGIAVFMRGPGSYTGEDVVEISLHGSPVILDAAVGLILASGARMAQRGEFTRRAFLNGKLDLLQAEAVVDLIESKTEGAAREARLRLDKGMSSRIANIASTLKDILAELEAHMDFDEDDENPAPDPESRLAALISEFTALQRSVDSSRMHRDGIRVVIAGKPNVGKSTLFNTLMGSNRVIVTPYPGTTRDPVDDFLVLNGMGFLLCDTAGMRQEPDPIEREGIFRTQQRIDNADIAIVVLDGSAPLDQEDEKVLCTCREKASITVLNKADLGLVIDPGHPLLQSTAIPISAKTGFGIQDLEEQLRMTGSARFSSDAGSLLSSWCVQPLASAEQHVKAVLDGLHTRSMAPEIIALELKKALEYLEEITGERADDGILDRIFERFCIGK